MADNSQIYYLLAYGLIGMGLGTIITFVLSSLYYYRRFMSLNSDLDTQRAEMLTAVSQPAENVFNLIRQDRSAVIKAHDIMRRLAERLLKSDFDKLFALEPEPGKEGN